MPQMVRNYDVVGVSNRQFFHQQQQSKNKRTMTDLELARIQLGNDVVDVKNYLCAHQPRDKCGEDLKIRHRVNMDDVIARFQMAPSQCPRRKQKERHQPLQVSQGGLFVFHSLLNAMDLHALNDFIGLLPLPSQNDCVHLVSSLD